MKRIISALMLLFTLAASAQSYHDLIDLGKRAYANKDYSRAAYLYEQALAQVDTTDRDTRHSIHLALRDCYFYSDQFHKAVDYSRRITFYDRSIPELADLTASSYLFTAIIYSKMQQPDRAYCYVDSARMYFNENGPSNTTRTFYTTLSILYKNLNDWDNASNTLQKILDDDMRRPLDNQRITNANLLGNYLYKAGRYTDSYQVFKLQQQWSEELFGKDSNEYRWATYTLANIIAFTGDVEQGCNVYMQVAELYRDKLRQQLRMLPSEQRHALLNEYITVLQNMVPYGLEAKCDADQFTLQAYRSLLLTKGILLCAERNADEIIERFGTEADRSDLQRLQQMRARLAHLEADNDRRVDLIASLYSQILQLDADIAARCSRYGDLTAFMDVDYTDVRQALANDQVLLDFAEIPHRNIPREYVCFEIRRDYQYPRIHRLCNITRIDSLLQLEGGDRARLYSGESAQAMQQLIGDRLGQIVGDARTVYVVPDGEFHRIALEAIPVGGKLLCERYDLHRLTSARELCLQPAVGRIDQATVYGGIDYGEGSFKPLAATQSEAQAIARRLGDAATVLSGYEGSKGRFLFDDYSNVNIIHIATHGYYYSPGDANAPASLQGYTDAMLRSGLVMANGNEGWSSDGSTGLLSAADIARCDLSHVRLACIASCHSAEGEITAEGVFGLQRGFKKAGVRSLILSMWDVNDAVTGEFMSTFYRELTDCNFDVHKAFPRARAAIRRQFTDPYYWAAFVLID